MKTLQLLTLTLFLSLTAFTNAQDASNDATWEETMNFLADYIPKFNTIYHLPYDVDKKNRYSSKIENNFIINKDEIWNGRIDIYKANLDDLRSIRYDHGSLVLIFGKGSVSDNDLYEQSLEERNNFISMNFVEGRQNDKNKAKWTEADTELQRLMNAFNHLAYLAGEKRKQSKF